MKCRKAYVSFRSCRYIQDVFLRCATAGLFLIIFLFPKLSCAQEEPSYEELSVFLNVPQIGVVEAPSYIKGNILYLSISDIFNFLKIQNAPSPDYDTIRGYFINPQSVFIVNRASNKIEYQNEIFELNPGDLIKTENNLYLRSDYFGKVFGLECIFDFHTLSVTLKTKLELPIIREMKQELMRRNIRRLKGEIKADTTIRRSYPFFRLGMIDWSILATQQLPVRNDGVLNLAIGSILAGGEANVTLNYNKNLPFTEKQQLYYWHFVNNELSAFRQVTVGKISSMATSSLNGSVLGVQVTNTPTYYRRSFSTYTLSDHTEPGWIVELYVNSVLVDYVKADASGFFTFEVPIVYGNSSVKLRFYGPWGEERTREEVITIPFNFLPPGKFEYMLSTGMVEDGKNSLLSRANFNYGAGQRLTVGGGVEYLSSVTSGSTMPFLDFSMRIASSIMMSGEYTYGVRGKVAFNYRLPSGFTMELNYINYKKSQTAVINPYLEDRRVALSLPVSNRKWTSYIRLSLDQIILEKSKYFSSELLLSGSVFGVSTNLTTDGILSDLGRPSFNSTLSLGLRLPKRIVITPQVQYDYSKNQFISMKFGVEKSLLQHGVLNLSYEYNFWGRISNLQIGMRYDFSFAQASFIANNSAGQTILGEMARGGLMIDQKTHYFRAVNRNNVGKGGIVIKPFLDLNCNGRHDPDEPRVTGLNLHITGGHLEQSKHDSTIRVFNLEPFINYFIEIDRSSFDNVAWQIRKPVISVAVDPNQFKLVEIPVSVLGEISGMVYIRLDSNLIGQDRIIVSIFRNDSISVAEPHSESDGYFSFLGLEPGSYIARIDPHQLHRLKMTSTPDSIPFTIQRSTDGDQVSGLQFVLHYLPADTSVLLAVPGETKVPRAKEEPVVPEKEKVRDLVNEQIREPEAKKNEKVPPVSSEKKEVRRVLADTISPMTKIIANQVPQTAKPEVSPVRTKPADTAMTAVISRKLPSSKQPESVRLSPLPEKHFIVTDSCDFAVQSGVSYTLTSALTAQKELADTFGRPVMIISEEGTCKLRICGFCGRNEAEQFLLKLSGKGFSGAYVLRLTGYSIQVGAFRVRAYALTAQTNLASYFSRPVLIVFEDGYYKVRITGFLRFSDAKKFLPELNDHGFPDTYLLKSH